MIANAKWFSRALMLGAVVCLVAPIGIAMTGCAESVDTADNSEGEPTSPTTTAGPPSGGQPGGGAPNTGSGNSGSGNTGGGDAAHGELWMTDYEMALKKAEETNRPVFAWFTGSDWCGWCIRLDNEVFSKPEFKTWARDNVVCVVLDYPQDKSKMSQATIAQNDELMTKFNSEVSGYPTILVLDHSEKVVGKLGYAQGGPSAWISLAEEQIGKGS